MRISDEYAFRGSVGTWFNGFLNVAIMFLTVELVLLNRQNVINGSRNAELLNEIKEKL